MKSIMKFGHKIVIPEGWRRVTRGYIRSNDKVYSISYGFFVHPQSLMGTKISSNVMCVIRPNDE